MTRSPRKWGMVCLIALGWSCVAARATDLNGAWASEEAVCDKIFQKTKNVISIRRASDFHGSGFIIDNNQIRGKMAKCSIKSRKEEGDLVHLIAVCSTDIALSTVQFSLKVDGDNRLTRIFPGMPEMSMSYVRCRI